MDRVELKNKAKEMIKGNKWYLWKPLLIIILIVILFGAIGAFLDPVFGLSKTKVIEVAEGIQYTQNIGVFSSIFGIAAAIIGEVLSVLCQICFSLYSW